MTFLSEQIIRFRWVIISLVRFIARTTARVLMTLIANSNGSCSGFYREATP
jgi:hypothetical protein